MGWKGLRAGEVETGCIKLGSTGKNLVEPELDPNHAGLDFKTGGGAGCYQLDLACDTGIDSVYKAIFRRRRCLEVKKLIPEAFQDGSL
ncbi:hypothetical protein MRB53_025368 [Persea americana]|uniref:Uncharacterized protein n=1 Tax=Persea americana TaxID=3435 RepID=A0ACC2LF86_PERAE|nr:hypothetical protein MRB53_025368 [Persea americana]